MVKCMWWVGVIGDEIDGGSQRSRAENRKPESGKVRRKSPKGRKVPGQFKAVFSMGSMDWVNPIVLLFFVIRKKEPVPRNS